jgi:hypothetical protein
MGGDAFPDRIESVPLAKSNTTRWDRRESIPRMPSAPMFPASSIGALICLTARRLIFSSGK